MRFTSRLLGLSSFALIALALSAYAPNASAQFVPCPSSNPTLNIFDECPNTRIPPPSGFAGTYGFDLNGGNFAGSHAVANGEIQLDSQGHVVGGFITCNFKFGPFAPPFEAYSPITNGCYCFQTSHSGFLTFNTNPEFDGFCATDDYGSDMDFTATPGKLHLTIDGEDENFDTGEFLPMGGEGEHE
jgi:hypothetical protein